MSNVTAPAALAAVLGAFACSGCHHYTFQQTRAPAGVTLRHEIRTPTYLNGFVGNGQVDTTRFCDRPVRTELRVTAVDVLISVATLLVYTPHTLYVTCRVEEDRLWRSFPGARRAEGE